MLDDKLREQLKAYLAMMTRPVEITAYTDSSDNSKEMMSLLEAIASVSDNVSLKKGSDPARRVPSFSLNTPGGAVDLSFAGLPMGHEFTSLVLALLQTGGYPPKTEPDVLEQIKALEGTFKFEVYISLTCQNCPEVVQALNLMAVYNPNVSTVMIDGALFQEEVTKRNIMAVPTVYLNGEEFSQGRMTVKEILAKVDTGSAKREAEKWNAKDPFDVLVIGGGGAAAAASIYAARKGIRTGLVTENFGGQILNTTDIENVIALKKIEGPQLASVFEDNVRGHAIDVMMPARAASVVPGDTISVTLENGAVLKSKTLIIATGASWRKLNVPGEEQYIGKGVAFCPHCDGPLFKGKEVAVIGGGNSAIEAAIDLSGVASKVTVFIRRDKPTADTVLVEKMSQIANITVLSGVQPSAVLGDGTRVNGIEYTDLGTNDKKTLALSGIFVQIGQVPTTGWLEGSGIELNKAGEIVVDAANRTSVPGIFAAGDVTSSPYKQIVIAMGDGAKASLSAFDYIIRH